jgi:hypothetical protein
VARLPAFRTRRINVRIYNAFLIAALFCSGAPIIFAQSTLGVTKGMISQSSEIDQAYLVRYRDKDGHALDGAKSYRLRVPPNPPARQFWSVTGYDIGTRSVILNKEGIAVRSSREALLKNADGSIDIYFAPTAPNGFERNWIPTVPGKAWWTAFRLYAPLQPYFDKSWPLPNIELVKRTRPFSRMAEQASSSVRWLSGFGR